MSESEYILGIDVGGTNIRLGLVDASYEAHDFVKESTEQLMGDESRAPEKLVEVVKKYIAAHGKGKEIRCISIGFPRKIIYSTPNIPGFNNVKMADLMEKGTGIPTILEKDVNMLMMFDMFDRNIPDEGITVGFYLGTGLGNAIAIDGKIYIGKNGASAELGHIPERNNDEVCGCGNKGCMELFASGKRLRAICDHELNGTFIGDVFVNHKDAPEIQKFIKELAIPIAAEINIMDPNYIILGGGLTQMEGFPKELLEEAIHEHTRKPFPEQTLSFKYSNPTQINGVVGAGIHGFKQLKKG